jgi:hypothetical protein
MTHNPEEEVIFSPGAQHACYRPHHDNAIHDKVEQVDNRSDNQTHDCKDLHHGQQQQRQSPIRQRK